jgi:hypothetical protein
VAFGLSVGSAILIFAVVIMETIGDVTGSPGNPNPSFYRATLLLPHAVYLGSVFSVYADEELFDFDMSIMLGFVALVFDTALMIAEVIRWTNCSALPVINEYICLNFPTWEIILPIIAVLIFLICLGMLFLVHQWHTSRIQYMALMQAAGTPAPPKSNQTPTVTYNEPNLDPEIVKDISAASQEPYLQHDLYPSARDAAYRASLRNWADTTLAALAVIHLIVLAAAAILALIYINSAAFYRGGYLNMSGIFVGASIAFFMVVSPGWRIYYLILGLLAFIFDVIGLVYEFPRYEACYGTTGPPANTIDANICVQDSWRGEVIPFALLISAILDIVEVIFIIIRMVLGSARYRTWREDSQARAAALASQEPTSVSTSTSTTVPVGAPFDPNDKKVQRRLKRFFR